MTTNSPPTFQYQNTNMVMLIGGQILVIAILAILFLFSSAPRSSLVPESLQGILGMGVKAVSKNASSS